LLHADCPHCGAAAPLLLAHPERFHCAHCRTTSPTPRPLRVALEASAAVVLRYTAKLRRLTAAQREARRRSGPLRRIAPLLLASVGLGTLAFLLMWPLRDVFRTSNAKLMVVVAPALMILPLVAAIVRLFWNHRKVQEVCTASPPPVQGAPARCGLCGADLRPATGPVADCEYCGTDNVVRSNALHGARVESSWAVARIEAEVSRRARIAAGGVGRGVASLLLAVPLAPLISITGVLALEELRWRRPTEIVLVPRSGATCVARAHPMLFWNGAIPSHGSRAPSEARIGGQRSDPRTHVDEDASRPPTNLIGRRAWTTDGRVGDIRAVTEPDAEDAPILFRIDTPTGSFRQAAEQTCLHAGPVPVALADLGPRPATERVRIVATSGHVVIAVDGIIALASQGRTTYLRLPAGRVHSLAVVSEHVLMQLGRRLVRFPMSALRAGGASAAAAPGAATQLLTSDMDGEGADFGGWFHWVQRGRDSSNDGVYRANGSVIQRVVTETRVGAVGAGPRHVYYTRGRRLLRVVPGSTARPEVVLDREIVEDVRSPIIDEGPSLLLSIGGKLFRLPRGERSLDQVASFFEEAVVVGASSLRLQDADVDEHRIPGLVLQRAGAAPRVVVPGAWLASYTMDATTVYFAAAEPAGGPGGWFRSYERRDPKSIVHHRVFSLSAP
jgi:hypothetical protein